MKSKEKTLEWFCPNLGAARDTRKSRHDGSSSPQDYLSRGSAPHAVCAFGVTERPRVARHQGSSFIPSHRSHTGVYSSQNGESGKENIGKRENKINLTSPCPQFHRHISCRPMLTKQDPWALGAREFMVSFGRRPQLGSARRPFYCRRPGFPFLPPHLDPRCCILAQSEPSCTVTTSRPFFFLV